MLFVFDYFNEELFIGCFTYINCQMTEVEHHDSRALLTVEEKESSRPRSANSTNIQDNVYGAVIMIKSLS